MVGYDIPVKFVVCQGQERQIKKVFLGLSKGIFKEF